MSGLNLRIDDGWLYCRDLSGREWARLEAALDTVAWYALGVPRVSVWLTDEMVG